MRSLARLLWLASLAICVAESRAGALETPLVLDGVIVAATPSDSIALVRLPGAARARPLRVGQSLAGFVLVEVGRGFARLERGGAFLRLSVGDDAAPAPAAPAAPPAEESDPWSRRAFSREEHGQRLEKEIPVILSDTELTPRVEGGEIRGLELLRIPDGTLLSESGLRPGDVIQSINGQPVHGLDALWRLLARFHGEGELRVVVERRGAILRLAYAISN